MTSCRPPSFSTFSCQLTAHSWQLSSLWRLTIRRHSEWTQECCLRKTGNGIVARSEESITLMTPYRLSSSQKQILHIRSGWRLTLSSLWRLTVPGHSEWTQECHMRRQGSGIVARSEESITRMTSYGFLYHGNRSFTFVQDDDWRFPHYDALPSPVILNEDKNAVGESQKTATWHRVKNLLRWWRLAANS